MIRLASRLAAGGGRESLVRLLLTAVGLALAVTMLLGASVAFPALHAHDVRRGWRATSEENVQPAQDESTTDPLLWRLGGHRFDGRDVVRVDVAALGPDAPVPPGLDELPGPGELAASPELRGLLDTTDPAMLGDRYPGRITATVGPDALVSPDDLVVFVGHEPPDLRDQRGVVTVRSTEAAPLGHDLTRFMRVVLVVGGVGLLLPVVVFVATATRLAAARREQRLAALRLAGATQGQVGTVAAVEAAIAAAAGTAVGFATFLAIRPSVARIPFDGASFYPSDLRISPAWAALIGLGVPALAIGAAIVSLRRIRISALGVARRAVPSRPTPLPLLLVAGGVALLLLVITAATGSEAETAEAYGIGLAFVMTIIGIVLSGPWLTSVVARGIARFGRRAPTLLAARRLQDNPAAGFRAISGVTLAVFVSTVFSGLAASVMATQDVRSSDLAPGVVAATPTPDPAVLPATPNDEVTEAPPAERALPGIAAIPRFPELDPARTDELVGDLQADPGVRDVVEMYAFPDDPELVDALIRSDTGVGDPVLVSCAHAVVLGVGTCSAGGPGVRAGDADDGAAPDADEGGSDVDGAAVVNLAPDGVDPTGVVSPLSARDLAALPVVAVAAVTDRTTAAVERARTRLELGIPGAPSVTGPDIDAEGRREVRTMQRVSDIGLSVTLVIAGCSLAVAVAGAIVERRQPFTLLRLTGTRLSDLRRVVLAEAAAPLLMVAGASVGLGLAVAALVVATGGGDGTSFVLPGLGYWLSLVGGLALALLVVLATIPLLNRLTAPDAARFE